MSDNRSRSILYWSRQWWAHHPGACVSDEAAIDRNMRVAAEVEAERYGNGAYAWAYSCTSVMLLLRADLPPGEKDFSRRVLEIYGEVVASRK